jgi:hypothetical protein
MIPDGIVESVVSMFDYNLNTGKEVSISDMQYGMVKGKLCFYHVPAGKVPYIVFSATADEMKKLFALMSKPSADVVKPITVKKTATKKTETVVDDLEVSSIQSLIDKAVQAALKKAAKGAKS